MVVCPAPSGAVCTVSRCFAAFCAAFAFSAGRSRRFLAVAAWGTVLCLGAAADGDLSSKLFYLGGALWLCELLRLHAKSLSAKTE